MKVVVVDDDPSILLMVKHVLQSKGHTVLTYKTPLECPLYRAKPCPCEAATPCPDVIITDYNMPEVDGVTFINDVRKRGCQCLHSAIISSNGPTDSQLSRLAKYDTRFFIKPLDYRELFAWLDRVAGKIPGVAATTR